MLFDQKIAIIGGSSGIGLAVAQAAVDAGAEVIIGSSSQTKIQGALSAFTERIEAWQIDVTLLECLSSQKTSAYESSDYVDRLKSL